MYPLNSLGFVKDALLQRAPQDLVVLREGDMTAIDLKTGAEHWSFKVAGPVSFDLSGDNQIVTMNQSGEVFTRNAGNKGLLKQIVAGTGFFSNGLVRWTAKDQVLAVFSSPGGGRAELRNPDGSLDKRIPVPYFEQAAFDRQSGTLYLGDGDGSVATYPLPALEAGPVFHSVCCKRRRA